ncbi:hypothetical protein FOCG_18006 [Fusarium oxysporum f. sp. radicis-lycopersici 26381]|uniref:Uncharacterized protein n=1 Tax=Fusarium oxysporum NRRL 32931 TaxID=660029 RepID=W9HG21_FUSOX|nr:hypothetical protein FOYG_16881 [Fusarium oxysporum NRRL 32931]EWZ77849.1 hypothetical protein FOWG_17777 [Fusarium oxysporum f. sp. lycopersici MN25]EXL39382.1 hypothetical protein FOCG_18006 [Fusarium oxysporum f. sp. radicis-lycopersici 26381]
MSSLEGVFNGLTGFFSFLSFRNPSIIPSPFREAQIITQRIIRDDPSKLQAKPNISKEEVKNLIPHVNFEIADLAPTTAMIAYGPTLVKLLGYERLESHTMASIDPWILL